MKTKVTVSKEFPALFGLVRSLPETFDDFGQIIHSGRNEIRTAKIDGVRVVVKYFKRMTLANRYIYALFRKSKAQRAYENSNWLNDMGITSPESIGFVDRYKNGMLRKSFFVSVYTDYKPIKELFALPISESEEGLKAFARFTYSIHQKGVFHHDYSESNILYRFDGESYDFALIDINRMRISGYSFRKGIKTLNRLAIPVERMGIVAAEYSRVSGINDLEMLNAMTFVRILHHAKDLIKKWAKAPIYYLAGKC